MSVFIPIGWYRDHGGTNVYRWWNGKWWSACAHGTWDAKTAAKQARVRSDSAPTSYSPLARPEARVDNPTEHLRVALGVIQDQLGTIASLQSDMHRMRDILRRIEAIARDEQDE